MVDLTSLMSNPHTGATLLVLMLCGVLGQALSPITVLSLDDQAKLKAVLAQTQPFIDLASAHYSILGLKLFNAPVSNAKVCCLKDIHCGVSWPSG